MKKAISIVFLLVQLSSSMKENVAHRELYYDGYDYVCHSGRPLRKDIILLVLDFDNRDQKTYFADGGTISPMEPSARSVRLGLLHALLKLHKRDAYKIQPDS